MGHQARFPQPEATARFLATNAAILMRVPLPLAALAPVEHGAYAARAGRGVGEVERCKGGGRLCSATPALSER
jgi:hypothetical protein